MAFVRLPDFRRRFATMRVRYVFRCPSVGTLAYALPPSPGSTCSGRLLSGRSTSGLFLIATSLGGLAIEKEMRFAIPFAFFADRPRAVRTQSGTQGSSLRADLFHVQIQLIAIALPGSWVALLIDFLEPIDAHMGVNLGSGNIRMAEDRLDGAEIRAAL
jgi:hypothetical protein